MKKVFGVLLAMVFMSFMISSVFAQMAMESGAQESDDPMMSSMMGDDGGMMCPMCGQPMKGMSQMPMMGRMMMGRDGMMMGHGGMMCPMCGDMKPMMGMMNMGMMEKIAEKLDLTKEQKDKAMAIFMAHHRDMIKKKADLELAQLDLYELMSKEDPDMDAIQKQVMDIATMKGDMQFSQIKVWMDAKALLTDEQKAALKKMMMGEKGYMMGGKWMKEMKESKSEKPEKSGKPGAKEMKK